MSERPIPFSAPMVRAVLAGTKTQTRRAIKPQPQPNGGAGLHPVFPYHTTTGNWNWVLDTGHGTGDPFPCPYGQPGDRLWVRESFSGPHHQDRHPPRDWHSTGPIHYWADGNPADGDWTKPRAGMFMPRWASRITLEITGVRVERLQDISEADALAESALDWALEQWKRGQPGYTPLVSDCFRNLWESINGPGSWAANPWVWCIEFRRLEAGNV